MLPRRKLRHQRRNQALTQLHDHLTSERRPSTAGLFINLAATAVQEKQKPENQAFAALERQRERERMQARELVRDESSLSREVMGVNSYERGEVEEEEYQANGRYQVPVYIHDEPEAPPGYQELHAGGGGYEDVERKRADRDWVVICMKLWKML